MELNQATTITDNKKYFYKCTNNKRRAKENIYHLLALGGNIVRKDEEKAKVLSCLRLVVVWVPSPKSWKTSMGSRMKPP